MRTAMLQSFASRRPRPMSFIPNDDLAWQETPSNDISHLSPSPRGFSNTVETDLISVPLEPNRWPRGVHSSEYLAIGSSRDTSTTEVNLSSKNSPRANIKDVRSYSDIFPLDDGPDLCLEAPKVAIRRGLGGNWAKLVPHIIAICVTFAVCQLSFRNVYWMDLRPPDQAIAFGLTQGGALNFLQLAAKIHELLILASISALVLHAVQAHLTGRSGLPLGMIAIAFELGSAQFLRRKSFWSFLWQVNPVTGRSLPYFHFWLLSLFSTILVTLAGPSSAIAVIPTLNYFDLPRPFIAPVLPYYVWNVSTELWPDQLTAASLNAPNSGIACNNPDSDPEQEICPVGGYSETYIWAGGLLFSDTDTGSNISFPDASSATRRVVSTQSCNSTFDGRASAVSLNSFVSGALTSYWIFAQENFHGIALEAAQPSINIDSETPIFAPRVEAMCNSYSNYYFDPENPDNQTDMVFPALGGASPIQVPDWSYKYSRPLNASNFTFVEISGTGPESPSLGAVLTLPLIENINGTWVQATENIACSMYSSWIPVDAWYQPTINDQVSYGIRASMSDTCLDVPVDATSRRQSINTTIDIDYANAINQPIDFITGNIPAMLGLYQLFIYNDSTYIPNGVIFKAPIPGVAGINVTDDDARRQRAKLVSTVLAGVVTDGLARNVGDGSYPYSAPFFLLPNRTTDGTLQGRFVFTSATGGQDEPLNTTNIADTSQWLRLSPAFQRYGYGWHWYGNRTSQFGISVLLVHLVVAMAHMAYVLIEILWKDKGLPRAWQTIPEFFALAVNSGPSEKLRNTCAGIRDSRTWNEPVAVREVSEGHLEMVLGRSKMVQMPRPRTGVGYGALPDTREVEEGSTV